MVPSVTLLARELAVIDLLDSNSLTGQASAQIDLLAAKIQASAAGDGEGPVAEVEWLADPALHSNLLATMQQFCPICNPV